MAFPTFNWNEWNKSVFMGFPKTKFAWSSHPDWANANFVAYSNLNPSGPPDKGVAGGPAGANTGVSPVAGDTRNTHSFATTTAPGNNGFQNGVYYDRTDGNLSANAVSDVQTVGVGAASAGTFTLTLTDPTVPVTQAYQASLLTTAAIAYNATPAAVQAALAALTLSDGTALNVVVTGAAPSWVVTFGGELAKLPVTLMTITASGLTGGTATVAHTTVGNDGSWMTHLESALTTALGVDY